MIPNLAYEDAAAAVQWLTWVFGFESRLVYRDAQGAIDHAELFLGELHVDVKAPSVPKRRRASGRPRGATPATSTFTSKTSMRITGPAAAEGAAVLEQCANQPGGDRAYRVADLEGHVWPFASVLREHPGSSPRVPSPRVDA